MRMHNRAGARWAESFATAILSLRLSHTRRPRQTERVATAILWLRISHAQRGSLVYLLH